jgi:hypothetical protein
MTPAIQKHLDELGVTINDEEWVRQTDPVFWMAAWCKGQASAMIKDGKCTGIALDKDVEHPEVVVWHELGHLKHPLGNTVNNNGPLPRLTQELAANSWALANYKGELERDHIINTLQKAIHTYINDGDITSIHTPELEQTAKTLGIYGYITWGENNDT